MKFGSVCSGIEAASVAFGPLGWEAAWFSEIEPFPCALLAHHYPEVPNLGDMTTIAARIRCGAVEAPDVFVGGTPCQAFSVAGLRNSLDDARGNLSLVFCEIANEIDAARSVLGLDPAIVFWENVPGVLSTKDNAFGCFLGELAGEDGPLEPPGGKWTNAGCVFGPQRAIAWRILDAQYFGVAQRRRRVFVVASAGAGFNPAEVLFEFDGVRRDTAPSRQAGEEVTPTIRAGASNGGAGHGARSGDSKDELIVPVAQTLRAQAQASHRADTETYIPVATLCVATGQAGAEIGAEIGADMAPTLNCNHEAPYVAHCFKENMSMPAVGVEVAPTLQALNFNAMQKAMQVRRLLPEECEALQGFSRGYTNVPHRGKPAADGPRYKSLGNSWAVPNVAWIGKRIQAAINSKKAAA